jgi:hypothetical protein
LQSQEAVVMEAVTAGGAAAVIMAEVIMAVVMAISSADGIMAAAIFTAGRRTSAHSPDIVLFPRSA